MTRRSFSTLQRVEIAEMLNATPCRRASSRFSTLQRVEIAEMSLSIFRIRTPKSFSTLQRVEIAEIEQASLVARYPHLGFSTLQRVEIAEIDQPRSVVHCQLVSVLFNESKLLKCDQRRFSPLAPARFSTLQRVEIAEIWHFSSDRWRDSPFQYSSTSRNC